MNSSVSVAAIQTYCRSTYEDNLQAHRRLLREAASQGAQIVCFQEIFTGPYFCTSEDPAHFEYAETIPGPTTSALQEDAKELGVVIIASLFEKRATGLYHNTTAVIDADGRYLGKYRKMHIPEDPGFHEKFYFTPGDLNYPIWETTYGKIGVLICWDQWYPEAARLVALRGAEIIFYPTAIGWLAEEKDNLGKAQHHAWETVQCGHAVANGCYIVTPNRIGTEKQIQFWGQSFVANPFGQVIARASTDAEEVLLATCDMKALRDFREIWPFFRDRRIESYQDITKRFIDS